MTSQHRTAIVLSIGLMLVGCGRDKPLHQNTPTDLPPFGHALSSIPEDSELSRPDLNKALAGSLRKLNITNPISDVEYNVHNGETDFVGIYGYSCSPPGLDQSGGVDKPLTPDQELLRYKRVKCIAGTGDVIPDDQQYRDLYQTAWVYAESYNRELLRRIRAGLVN